MSMFLCIVSASHYHLVENALRAAEQQSLPPSLILPSSDHYCCEVMVEGEGRGVVCVLVGECKVNGEPASAGGKGRKISNGECDRGRGRRGEGGAALEWVQPPCFCRSVPGLGREC